MIRWVAISLSVIELVALAHAESWRIYSNARFGTTAEVPADWRPGRPPDNKRRARVHVTGWASVNRGVRIAAYVGYD